MIDSACAFTGHRPKSFPWKYDETAPDCVLLKEVLAEQIKILADRGVIDWLSGMAQGVDLWCAQIVLDLRKENPALNLHCVLPYEGQADEWSDAARKQYHLILRQADEVVYVGREYSGACMRNRNYYLVDHSSILLAVYNGVYRSGTGMTVRYAQKLGREIFSIDPITRKVEHRPSTFSMCRSD